MCSTVIQHLIHFYQPSGGSVAPNDLNCRFWPKIDHFWAISETQPVIKNVKKCVLITRVSPQTLLKPLKHGFTWKTDVALISLHCPIWHTVLLETWINETLKLCQRQITKSLWLCTWLICQMCQISPERVVLHTILCATFLARDVWSLGDNGTTNHHHHHR